jgi:hypothetical protein
VFCSLAAGARAHAIEASAFVSAASPTENWSSGYGAALGSTWFRLVIFEAELARQPFEVEGGMTSFTASAFLAPKIGKLRPFGGFGAGLFRQSLGSDSDTGRLKIFALGLKAELGLIVLKGEYRRLDLSGEPLAEVDRRLSFGVGLAF